MALPSRRKDQIIWRSKKEKSS